MDSNKEENEQKKIIIADQLIDLNNCQRKITETQKKLGSFK